MQKLLFVMLPLGRQYHKAALRFRRSALNNGNLPRMRGLYFQCLNLILKPLRLQPVVAAGSDENNHQDAR